MDVCPCVNVVHEGEPAAKENHKKSTQKSLSVPSFWASLCVSVFSLAIWIGAVNHYGPYLSIGYK